MKIALLSYHSGVTSIRLEGALTQMVVSAFGDPFRDQLGPGIYDQTLLVDMSDVDWMDSSGIGWLLSCLKRFRQGGGRMVLHSLPARVSDVFRVLNLKSTFEIVADAEAAENLTRGEPA